MILYENATLQEKLAILSDAAKYDVACTSSGVSRQGREGSIGNTASAGICHTFSGDGRCISLLKILYTNECIFDCKYCVNRQSNDVPRASFTPEEICDLTMEFYKRNYIEGLFLSSGVLHSPNETMEQICKALHDLRVIHRFNGYIHCKAIPGAAPELVEMAGWYADRMSINLEFPTESGLKHLAPNKTRRTILAPMRQIQNGVAESREVLGMKGGNYSAYHYTKKRVQERNEMIGQKQGVLPESNSGQEERGKPLSGTVSVGQTNSGFPSDSRSSALILPEKAGGSGLTQWNTQDTSRGFVPAGQSTQMIIGATGESDYEIMSVSEALYERFDLKRVFYSAFINVNQDATLPAVDGQPPLRREHRLYQADFLLRYYGFAANELLSQERPNFNTYLDPKCDWALRHLEQFPVEINNADMNTLLRVPGIGVKSARRILGARRTGKLDFGTLKSMGVVLKRAIYFITCNGKMFYDFLKVDENYITRNLLADDEDVMRGFGEQVTYRQLTLFDDFQMGGAAG
ncbi:MAG: putative DNA modification/repair radical SAM protein [Lachnospiraceae bacterium]|nr:putative DNA modification/repair radical SAM protein [Lachnospiraceae bacterium]